MEREKYGVFTDHVFQSCLQQLYEKYMSREYVFTEETEQCYQQLEESILSPDFRVRDAVVSAANALCAIYEREAFAAGFQMGAGMILHLEKLNNL